jgi:hypothetical protein
MVDAPLIRAVSLRAVSVGLLLVACGAPATSAADSQLADARQPPAGDRTPATAHQSFADAQWGLVVSSRLSLKFALPERRRWRVEDPAVGWLTARHAATDSTLMLQGWREPTLVDHRDCERLARQTRADLPEFQSEEIVDRLDLERPPGYDTEFAIAVRRTPSGVHGYALGFGGAVRRCFMLLYETRAHGLGAERSVGDRLGFVVQRIVATLRSRSIDERVPRRQ